MQAINTLLHIVQVLTAVALIGLVLIQQGKGADAGAAFGSGASSTVFGSRGAGSFLSRLTAGLAAVFLINSLLLAYISVSAVRQQETSVIDQISSKAIEATIPGNTDSDEATGGPVQGEDEQTPVLSLGEEGAAPVFSVGEGTSTGGDVPALTDAPAATTEASGEDASPATPALTDDSVPATEQGPIISVQPVEPAISITPVDSPPPAENAPASQQGAPSP